MFKKILNIGGFLILTTLVAACQSTQVSTQKQQSHTIRSASHYLKHSAVPTAQVSSDGVQDVSWQITQIQQQRAKFFNHIPNIRLNSSLNTVTGHTGCNPIFGRYHYNFAQSTLNFDVKAGHQSCDGALVQEANLMDLLQRVTSFKVQGSELLLLDQNSQILIKAQRK